MTPFPSIIHDQLQISDRLIYNMTIFGIFRFLTIFWAPGTPKMGLNGPKSGKKWVLALFPRIIHDQLEISERLIYNMTIFGNISYFTILGPWGQTPPGKGDPKIHHPLILGRGIGDIFSKLVSERKSAKKKTVIIHGHRSSIFDPIIYEEYPQSFMGSNKHLILYPSISSTVILSLRTGQN